MWKSLYKLLSLGACLIGILCGGCFKIGGKPHAKNSSAELVISCSTTNGTSQAYKLQYTGTLGAAGGADGWADAIPLHVIGLKNGDFTTCDLKRMDTNGEFTVKIFQKTNLVYSVTLPEGKTVMKLKKNDQGWQSQLE